MVIIRVEPHFATIISRVRRIRGGRDYSNSNLSLLSSVGQSASLVMRMSAVRIRQEAHLGVRSNG